MATKPVVNWKPGAQQGNVQAFGALCRMGTADHQLGVFTAGSAFEILQITEVYLPAG